MNLFVSSCNDTTIDINPLQNLQHSFDTLTELDEAILNEFLKKGAAMFQLAINIKAAKACLLNFKDVAENILKDQPSTTQQAFCQNPSNDNFIKWARASTLTAKKELKSSPAKKSLSQILQNMRQTQGSVSTQDPFLHTQSTPPQISPQDQAIISNNQSTTSLNKPTLRRPLSAVQESSEDDELLPLPTTLSTERISEDISQSVPKTCAGQQQHTTTLQNVPSISFASSSSSIFTSLSSAASQLPDHDQPLPVIQSKKKRKTQKHSSKTKTCDLAESDNVIPSSQGKTPQKKKKTFKTNPSLQ